MRGEIRCTTPGAASDTLNDPNDIDHCTKIDFGSALTGMWVALLHKAALFLLFVSYLRTLSIVVDIPFGTLLAMRLHSDLMPACFDTDFPSALPLTSARAYNTLFACPVLPFFTTRSAYIAYKSFILSTLRTLYLHFDTTVFAHRMREALIEFLHRFGSAFFPAEMSRFHVGVECPFCTFAHTAVYTVGIETFGLQYSLYRHNA